jgi:hypothetical protein
MKKLIPWVVSVLAGLLLMFLFNLSPLSRLGLSIELPWGWDVANIQHDCMAQGETDQNIHPCAFCAPQHDEGIPFAFNRQTKATYCSLDSNNLAMLLDAAIGAGIGASGMLYIIAADKGWIKK